MRRREALWGGVAALASMAIAPHARAEPEAAPEALARWLAGVSPLGDELPGEEWLSYAEMERERWQREAPRIRAMEEWSSRQLSPRIPRGARILYPFGGPDALHAMALFGGASRVSLVGLEPVGDVPSVPAPPGYFDALGDAMADVHRLTFYRTRDLREGLALLGTLPVLLATVPRMGGHVKRVARPATDRASVDWVSRDGGEHRLDYAQVDLGNASLARRPEVIAWLREVAPSVTFLKAASYLLGDERFSFARRLLLEVSDIVVQDDSGLPFSSFDGRWATRLFGRYVRPTEPFEDRAQPQLEAAFARQTPSPLPFGIGYPVRPASSNLVVAVRLSR